MKFINEGHRRPYFFQEGIESKK